MKKISLLLIFLFATPLLVYSQTMQTITDNNAKPGTAKAKMEMPSHYIGGSASSLSGAGLSYHYFDGLFAYKVTGMIFYNETDGDNSYNDDYLISSLGVELQYTLHQSHNTRFYALVGISNWYDEDNYNYSYYPYEEEEKTVETDIQRDWNFGAGIGFELVTWNHVSFAVDIGYKYMHTSESRWGNNYNNGTNQSKFIGFCGGVGLYYCF